MKRGDTVSAQPGTVVYAVQGGNSSYNVPAGQVGVVMCDPVAISTTQRYVFVMYNGQLYVARVDQLEVLR